MFLVLNLLTACDQNKTEKLLTTKILIQPWIELRIFGLLGSYNNHYIMAPHYQPFLCSCKYEQLLYYQKCKFLFTLSQIVS